MKRKDAFNKYIDTVYKQGFDKGHAAAMEGIIFSCAVWLAWDIIDKKKQRKTEKEICENNLNNHIHLDKDDEE